VTSLKIGIVACVLSCGLPFAQAQAELRTTGSTIACLAPDKLAAVEEASTKHDRAQMDMLGCFPVAIGTLAKRIDGASGQLWHVILDPSGPDPTEVWARPSSFRE
jgi:hypothetical protein